MYHLRVPTTEQELKDYYQFRWEMLRKPLHQPVGSEKDAYDAMAHHQMVVDEQGDMVSQRDLPRMALIQPAFKLDDLVLRAPGMLALHVAIDAVETPTTVTVPADTPPVMSASTIRSPSMSSSIKKKPASWAYCLQRWRARSA